MAKNLVIVESPAKAKTIEGYLGKDFVVKSSYGHVRDLVKSGMGVNVAKNFEPVYEVSPDKKPVIDELRKLVKKTDTVWLATDEDREGEAISWHLFEALDLDEDSTRRIVFHEITKKAILNAIDNPRTIDKNLVNAQQARRILDRLVGFELSPILWKKVRPQLSAGRVQSVTVRLIVEREREIQSFEAKSYYRVIGIFSVNGKSFKAELSKRFASFDESLDFLKSCIGAQFQVSNLEIKPGKRNPSPPFTTSTLQQEASRKLGFSVAQTMVIAQKLYERGLITYMRTDSVNLSQEALQNARAVIIKQYGERYLETRQYKTKIASAQEAHEAIRPTDFNAETIEGDSRDQKLYELIWKRALASQMSEALIEKTIITVQSSNSDLTFAGTGEVIKFDGFLKLYMEGNDEESDDTESGLLPQVTVGEALALEEATATQRFTYPPARFTEASLVKKLEELGIGRPSTYAPTISTVQKRGYVVKEERQGKERVYDFLQLKDSKVTVEKKTEITGAEKNKLFPTDIGMLVNDFLVENFKDILDFKFTAFVEKEFDDIANGELKWTAMLREFYDPFHRTVEVTEKESERVTGERILGKDPASGFTVLVRVGRYGPMAQIGTTEETDKPRFAKLRANQRLESITFEEAIELFKLPRNIGRFEEKDVIISIGRFGPYIRLDDFFVSLKKEDDPYTIQLDRAIELIKERRIAQAERIIKTFVDAPDIQVLKGRWGPFIKYKGKNIRIPKGTEPHSLTVEEIEKLAGGASTAAKASKKDKPAKKATTAKKKAAKKTSDGKKKKSVKK